MTAPRSPADSGPQTRTRGPRPRRTAGTPHAPTDTGLDRQGCGGDHRQRDKRWPGLFPGRRSRGRGGCRRIPGPQFPLPVMKRRLGQSLSRTKPADAQSARLPLCHAFPPLPFERRISLPSRHAALLNGNPPRLPTNARRHFTERTLHEHVRANLLPPQTKTPPKLSERCGALRTATLHSICRLVGGVCMRDGSGPDSLPPKRNSGTFPR
jgi:hypothetical protein